MTTVRSGSQFARSFGVEASRYAQVRPSYPAVAIDFVLANHQQPQRILDLGAGTGKLTQQLAGRAGELLAIEPDAAMRAVLEQAAPQARTLDGSAEQLPLPDACLDAILVGQAFHWFSRPAVDREMARVLRPGGVVGLLWNFPDRTVEWVRDLYQALRDPQPPANSEHDNLDDALFTASEESWTGWSQELAGPAALLDLAHTWSWVITRSAAEQAAIDRRVAILVTRHAELQGETISFPYRTKALRQYRR